MVPWATAKSSSVTERSRLKNIQGFQNIEGFVALFVVREIYYENITFFSITHHILIRARTNHNRRHLGPAPEFTRA